MRCLQEPAALQTRSVNHTAAGLTRRTRNENGHSCPQPDGDVASATRTRLSRRGVWNSEVVFQLKHIQHSSVKMCRNNCHRNTCKKQANKQTKKIYYFGSALSFPVDVTFLHRETGRRRFFCLFLDFDVLPQDWNVSVCGWKVIFFAAFKTCYLRCTLSRPNHKLSKVEEKLMYIYVNSLWVCKSERGLKVVVRGNLSKCQILIKDMKWDSVSVQVRR